MVKSSEHRKMLRTRAMIVEVICHGVMLLADVPAWPGSVSSLSLLVVPSISICAVLTSNLGPYMFRISMVGRFSCRSRCVGDLMEGILEEPLLEHRKSCADENKSCEKSWRGQGKPRERAWRQVKVVEGAMRDRAASLAK